MVHIDYALVSGRGQPVRTDRDSHCCIEREELFNTSQRHRTWFHGGAMGDSAYGSSGCRLHAGPTSTQKSGPGAWHGRGPELRTTGKGMPREGQSAKLGPRGGGMREDVVRIESAAVLWRCQPVRTDRGQVSPVPRIRFRVELQRPDLSLQIGYEARPWTLRIR
jgi:hypothetical protein